MKETPDLNYADTAHKNVFYYSVVTLAVGIFAILIGVYIVSNPTLVFTFLAIGVLFCVSTIRPEIVVPFIYLIMLMVGTGVSIFQIGSMNVNLIDGLLLIFVLPLIPRLIPKKSRFLRLNASIKLIISLIFLGITIGLLFGNNQKLVRNDIHELLYIPIMYVLVLATVKTKKQIKLLTYVIIIATSVAAFKTIYIAFRGYTFPLLGGSYTWQAHSWVNPQFQGQVVHLWGADTFFAVTFPFLFGLILYSSWKSSRFMILPFGAIFIALLLSYTRTHWFAISFAILSAVIYAGRRKRGLKIHFRKLIILFIALIPLLIVTNMKYGQSLYTGGELLVRRLSFSHEMGSGLGGTIRRLRETSAVLSEVKNHIVFGNGFGAEYHFRGFRGELKGLWTHNGYAWMLLKTGLVGLVIFCFVMVQTFKRGLRAMRKLQDSDMKAITVGYLGGLFVLLLMSFAVNRISSFEGCIYIGTCMGLTELLRNR